MNPHTAAQKEELRREALTILATRNGTALVADGIRRRMVTSQAFDFPIDNDDVTEALHFLAGKGYVASHHDGLGSSLYWQATSDGVLYHERGR